MKSEPTIGSKAAFNEKSLPIAVGALFEMNNYDVQYDIHVHGAQIDLVATAKGDPFAVPIYVEATVEYVSNDKYGKDSTKFLLISRKQSGAKLVCVSSSGFTASVRERAKESGIDTFTYDELFAKFEKFSPYLSHTLSDTSLSSLIETYEEPFFSDAKGKELATGWLSSWKEFSSKEAKWLIILGEYGTGKTSLTRVLQGRWLKEYHENPANPIPIRIELRNFSKQFDSNGLLHHFLDTNKLGHIPIEFMRHLIRTGRVIMLLDGYDEMAQFLNSRERRACLSSLADFASEGAKGILTSRPNYFTEAEELNVFEALYRSLEQTRMHLSGTERDFIAREKHVDDLVGHYILNRYERSLQDLTPQQTQSLVRRRLKGDVKGQSLILGMLDRVFREEVSGSKQSLSGKPVIISYLLELVDDLRVDATDKATLHLTEWQIYKLIVDKLMLRDMQRTPMYPSHRRAALQKLALALSGREQAVAEEVTFYTIIDEVFHSDLRLLPPDERRGKRSELFEDLRSSATLTRSTQAKADGWVFSHNSLREFLVAEFFLTGLRQRSPKPPGVPISMAMRSFVASISESDREEIWEALTELWPQRASQYEIGPYLNLLWEAARRGSGGTIAILQRLSGREQNLLVDLNSIVIKDVNLYTDLGVSTISVNGSGSTFSDSNFGNLDLFGSNFKDTIFDTVSFRDSDVREVNFSGAFIFECNLTGTNVAGADFRSIDQDSVLVVENDDGSSRSLSGNHARGLLKYRGAIVDEIEDFFVYKNHPKYAIIKKIMDNVIENRHNQLRGLTQRGEARIDPPFARKFVDMMASAGWLSIDKNDLVSVLPAGRPEIQRMTGSEYLAPLVSEFLSKNL